MTAGREQLQALRLSVIEHLTNEQGKPLVLLPWWRDAVSALDDPSIRELILRLLRQDGKSTLCGAISITELLCVANSYTVLVAASEKQQQIIFNRKLRKPLERLLRHLGQEARFTKNGVEFRDRNSALEVVASTEDTTPGRTVTLLVIDEARHVRDEVYTALAPSVIGSGGKVVIASTSGPPRGFFYQLVTHPSVETWLYESNEHSNPYANRGVLDFLRTRLALVSPGAARRELHGEFVDDGEELIPFALIDAAVDNTLGELPSSHKEAFGFVDLSRRRDLTSCVVVTREPARRPEATDHLVVASIRTWDPRQSPSGETDFADVRAHVAALPARFPGLRKLLVDEGAEGGSLLPFTRQHPALALVVEGFIGSAQSNMELWSALAARLNGGTLSLPRHERLLLELRGLRREEFSFGAKWRVVDGSRKFHRDVSLALAGACLAAGQMPRCAHCGNTDCDGLTPPLGLIGSPEVERWFSLHPDPDAPPNSNVSARADMDAINAKLLALAEPWTVALEADDDSAAADALGAMEQFVCDVENRDSVLGGAARALLTRVVESVEVVRADS